MTLNKKIYLVCDIKKHITSIVKQIPKENINKIIYNGLITIANINSDSNLWGLTIGFDVISKPKILFNNITVDNSNDKYDIVYWNIISPDVENIIYQIYYNIDRINYDISLIKKQINNLKIPIIHLNKGYKGKIKYKPFTVFGDSIKYNGENYLFNEIIKNSIFEENNVRLFKNNILTEGLLYTYSFDSTNRMINNTLKIPKTDVKSYNDKYGQIIHIRLLRQENGNYDEDRVVQHMNTYGWFLSTKTNEGKALFLKFEPKYDVELTYIEKNNNDFYHLTPYIIYDNKISKIGLTPKTQSKQTYHPDRVYLTTNVSDLERLMKQLYNTNKQNDKYKNEYSLLKINNVYNLKLFKDTNYDGGVYTLENIKPDNVIEVERYRLDNNGNVINRIK